VLPILANALRGGGDTMDKKCSPSIQRFCIDGKYSTLPLSFLAPKALLKMESASYLNSPI
jgi:hypothetical protein